MIKKTKLFLILGITLLINSVFCIAAFASTYKEKKNIAFAFWTFAVALGASGAVLTAVYASWENIRLKDLRRAIAEKDHWFHSFEYPECIEPTMNIEDTVYEPVETEDEEVLPF